MGFWYSIEGGIILNVMVSHRVQMFSQSSSDGMPKGDEDIRVLGTSSPLWVHENADVGAGKVKAGRSRSPRE